MSNERAARKRLEQQRDDLRRRLDRIQGAERDETAASGNVAGETDTAHEWENAETRKGQIQETLDELRQTEAALARVDSGEFGRCAICGNPIEAERLELIPEATRCENHM